MDCTTGDSVLGSLSNAMSDISRAKELSTYMEMFISGDEFEEGKIGPVSLRDSLYSALECAGLSSTKDSVQVVSGVRSIELKMEQDCSVQANAFLVDAFQYILEGIAKRIGRFEDIIINIRELEELADYCICDMKIDVYVEDTDNQLGLFKRYVERGSLDAVEIAYSKSIVRLLGGRISLSATDAGPNNISITVTVQLKRA
jgi:hypothetical protein